MANKIKLNKKKIRLNQKVQLLNFTTNGQLSFREYQLEKTGINWDGTKVALVKKDFLLIARTCDTPLQMECLQM